MNYKFFGNSLDLFKYDILTFIVKNNDYKLNYIPMLTYPEEKKNDPKYKLFEVGHKNAKLNDFINKVNSEELDVEKIDVYFNELNIRYDSFFNLKNIGIDYFENSVREKYFEYILSKVSKANDNIIFIDPDVGIDIGISRRVRSNRNMYLKKEELDLSVSSISNKSFVVFFQHLGNFRVSLDDRKESLKKFYGENILIVAYKRILASLVFVFKDHYTYLKTKDYLYTYINNYKEIEHFDKLKIL